MKNDYITFSETDSDGVKHETIDLLKYSKAKRPDLVSQFQSHYDTKELTPVKVKASKKSGLVRKPA